MPPPSAPLPGNARGRATRQRLLESAGACFGELGYAAVRVSDVTDRAAVSHGAFYRHFKDKKELLLEALQHPLDDLLTAMETAATKPLSRAAVVAATTEFFTVYARHRRVLRVLRELAAEHDPELTRVWLDVRHRYVDVIHEWLARSPEVGRADPIDDPLLAEALGAVLDQLAYTRIGLARDDIAPDDVRRLGTVAAHVWAASLGLP